ncbi:MAG: PEP-CTERM sorting domain-containing protein [Planctomycetota bacterium]
MKQHPKQSLACLTILGIAICTQAQATVIEGSSGYVETKRNSALFFVDPPSITEDVFGDQLSGVAPAPYSDSITIPPAFGSSALGSLSVESDVDGSSGTGFARVLLDDPGFSISVALDIDTGSETLDFDLEISGLTMAAEVSGGFGNLVETTSVTFDSITATLDGVDLGISTSPAPNTVLIDQIIGGFDVFYALNVQTIGGDGTSNRSIEVIGLLDETTIFENGEISSTTIGANGTASAALTAVPEPTSLALLGLGGLLVLRRSSAQAARRRRL